MLLALVQLCLLLLLLLLLLHLLAGLLLQQLPLQLLLNCEAVAIAGKGSANRSSAHMKTVRCTYSSKPLSGSVQIMPMCWKVEGASTAAEICLTWKNAAVKKPFGMLILLEPRTHATEAVAGSSW
jgi:hypothetical protein